MMILYKISPIAGNPDGNWNRIIENLHRRSAVERRPQSKNIIATLKSFASKGMLPNRNNLTVAHGSHPSKDNISLMF